MARVVLDKKDHIKRLTDLQRRVGKLSTFLERLLSEFSSVKSSDYKQAAHSYVRMLSRLYHEFDIDDAIQKQVQSDIYALLLGSVNNSDYKVVVEQCLIATRDGIAKLNIRNTAIIKEIDNA